VFSGHPGSIAVVTRLSEIVFIEARFAGDEAPDLRRLMEAFADARIGRAIALIHHPIYQRLFGFSVLMLTAIFALYVIGTLCALLLLGNLSDYLGRKPVLMLALAVTLLGSIAFVAATGAKELFVGRFLCGLEVGMFGAAGAVALAELEPHGDRSRAALFATAANMIGLVVGSLLSGELAQYASSRLSLPWLLQIVFVVASMMLLRTSPARRHLLPSKPWSPQTLAVPPSMRHLFVACAAAAFSLSAIMGFFCPRANADARCPSIARRGCERRDRRALVCGFGRR
jgi:MFS family permease